MQFNPELVGIKSLVYKEYFSIKVSRILRSFSNKSLKII